jgi:hypothetical protein
LSFVLTTTAALPFELPLDLTATVVTASFGSGATGGAELVAGFGAGLLAFGARVVAPLFVLLLSPSPLPPIWWSLWWVGLSWR